ncbi:MAG: hypothetical protein QNK23_14860 [Crocinitomicaceae bacterium]|nr:hypothetical protein [Crocinitomicaceae bacterium]
MIRIVFATLLISILVSCGDETPTTDEPIVEIVPAEIPDKDLFTYDTLQGMYIGDFGGSEIRIILNYISQKNAIGYNIHKGLQRNINGKVYRNGDSVQLILREPGDNEYDGVFTINFNGIDINPTGVWESNSGEIPSKQFTLSKIVKHEFDYEAPVTTENFHHFFDYVSDSIGDYRFFEDGLCILEYYPETKGDEEEQYQNIVKQFIEIKGSWSLNESTLTIDWQPNDIYKDRKLVLEVVNSEWGEKTFEGAEDHWFYNHFYGP